MRNLVNEHFVLPIIQTFFADKGGIDQYSALDLDLVKTEIDFEEDLNFVKGYLYRSVITEITKEEEGLVRFSPRYVLTFDEDLTPLPDSNYYPYSSIFGDCIPDGLAQREFSIHFGTMELGQVPILYFIRLHLPTLIRFIKLHRDKGQYESFQPLAPINKAVGNLYQTELNRLQQEIRQAPEPSRRNELEQQATVLAQRLQQPAQNLQGNSGQLRINLSWDTIDDLDLHVIDPDGNEIFYQNMKATCQGNLGVLDVDANAGSGTTMPPPQENIFWTKAPIGAYKVFVHLFAKRDPREHIPFVINIIGHNSMGRAISGTLSHAKERLEVATFTVDESSRLSNIQKRN